MKKHILAFVFVMLAVLVSNGTVQAETSIFNSSASFDLSSIESGFLNEDWQNRYTLTITNRAKWTITQVYVETSENQRNWGKEWLNGRLLEQDTFIELTNLKPGEYDVRFVDEDGYECFLLNTPITKSKSWALTQKWLDDCQARSN